MIGAIQEKAAEFIVNNLGRIVLVLVIIAALLFSHWFVYNAGKKAVEAENNAVQVHALQSTIKGLIRADQKNLAQTQKLLDAERAKKAQVEYVKSEITKYVSVQKDVDCSVDPDIVRLLNESRMPASDASGPGLSENQGTAPGSIGYVELLQDNAEIATKYENLRQKYNAWIDWYEDGLKEQNRKN